MSYLLQAYNWYYDIHPNRPKLDDYRKKNMVVKQIRDMKQFKFKNKNYNHIIEISIPPVEEYITQENITIENLIKNKNKSRKI